MEKNLCRVGTTLYVTAGLLLNLGAGSAPAAAGTTAESTSIPQARQAHGQLPLSFELNRGQTAGEVDYLARGSGYRLYLTGGEAVLVFDRSEGPRRSGASPAARKPVVLRLELEGASAPEAKGTEQLRGIVSYFRGSDPAKWLTGIPTFRGVRYERVYPGIDLVYYGNQRQLEYDFVVAPGADPNRIALSFAGSEGMRVEKNGDLVLQLPGGAVRWLAPVAYQEAAGKRQPVASRYALKDGRVTFALGAYDRNRPLVIDPILAYMTYLGGTGFDVACDNDVDCAGNHYVTGATDGNGFPGTRIDAGTGGAGGGGGPADDAFVTKINPTGDELVYSVIFGGSDMDFGNGIRVDPAGQASVVGYTRSANYPVSSGAFQRVGGVGPGIGDGFVARVSADGQRLVYSSYLGGSGDDNAARVALDSANNAYVSGMTASTNFPTTGGAHDRTLGGVRDAFVTKVAANGSSLTYSTYLGGSAEEWGYGIIVDGSGNAYTDGWTESVDFPTRAALQAALRGSRDAFITRLNASGSSLVFSTYLGGSGLDAAYDIVLGPGNDPYVAGETNSADFPVTGFAFQRTKGAGFDVFVARLPDTGATLKYSTFLGGSGSEVAWSVDADAEGNAYVAGRTSSANFPILDPVVAQTALNGTYNGGVYAGAHDGFLTKLAPFGNRLVYSTYLGGRDRDDATGVAVDTINNAYVCGLTLSDNMPTTPGAFDPTYNGFYDGWAAKVGTLAAPNCDQGPGGGPGGEEDCCKVTGGGWIAVDNGPGKNKKGTFGAHAMCKKDGSIQGSVEYQDHSTGMNVHSKDVRTLSVSGTTATYTGVATINGSGAFDFVITVTDNGEPGRSDTFRIELSTGYTAEGTLGGGNIQLHCK